MLSTSITNNSITIVVTNANGNKVFTINKTHPNYDQVLDAIRNGEESKIESLCNIATAVENFYEGKVSVKNGQIYYGNLAVNGPIVDRVIEFAKNKLPVQPLLKFINKLYENPSARAVNELYSFLEHKNMPITPDGNFLAYKGVRSDYYSITAGNIQLVEGKVDSSGRIFNGVGEEIAVVRNQVCDDKNTGCSKGLHAGSVKYATEFGAGGKVVIVEINPADVVSIPTDCECQKLRTCAYKVVGEYQVPLDNNYCDEYCDDECSDEEYSDEDYQSDESDDAAELEKEQHSYSQGYDAGWQDADSGLSNCVNDRRADSCDYPESYRAGYQDGYDDGLDEDESCDSSYEEDCPKQTGFDEGYRDGMNKFGFDLSNAFNYACDDERNLYETAYREGYDAGVKNRASV